MKRFSNFKLGFKLYSKLNFKLNTKLSFKLNSKLNSKLNFNLIFTFIFILFFQNTTWAKSVINSNTNLWPLNENKKTIVFIHGSPGDHKAFNKYFSDPTLNEKFNMISIDRPGFGKSKKFKIQPNMKEQADLISQHLIEDLKIQNTKQEILFFSHSYGAPLSVLVSSVLSSANQHLLVSLILVSGPYNPEFNMIRWYNHLAALPLARGLIGKFWRNSNEEMLKLNQDLNLVQEQLKSFKGKTYFVHGQNDGLVPIKHSIWADQLRKKLGLESKLLEFKTNHFIIWNNFKKMRALILDFE